MGGDPRSGRCPHRSPADCQDAVDSRTHGTHGPSEGGQRPSVSLAVFLHGHKLIGGYALTRIGPVGARERWLLVKEADEYADRTRDPVRSKNIAGDLANPRPDLLAAIHESGRRLPQPGKSAPNRAFKDQNHNAERSWCVPQLQQRASAASRSPAARALISSRVRLQTSGWTLFGEREARYCVDVVFGCVAHDGDAHAAGGVDPDQVEETGAAA